MIGKTIRLQRLFNGNLAKENVVICAVDHGMFQGVQPGLERMPRSDTRMRCRSGSTLFVVPISRPSPTR